MFRGLLLITFVAMLASDASIASDNPWHARYQPAAAETNAATLAPQDGHHADATAHTREKIHLLSYAEVEQHIAEQLIMSGAGDKVEVNIMRTKAGELLRHHAAINYELEDLHFSAARQKWEATLYPHAEGRPLAPIALEGRYKEMTEVPVLTRRIHADEVIQADDVRLVAVARNRLRDGTALSARELIGKSPRRIISENRPVRLVEVIEPPIVQDGENVTMQYQMGALTIHAAGRLLDSGSKGQTVRVRNTASKQIIRARVVAPGVVEAIPLGMMVAAK
jgi:flagella basal body P-ring formation protein FlgA